MSFLSPAPPPFELEEWKRKPHLARIKPLVQDWGENGFGSPSFVYLLYAFKLVVYAVGALLVISTDAGAGRRSATSATGGRSRSSSRSSRSGRCSGRSSGSGRARCRSASASCPPIGGPLYWLRPGTVRLPPWPDKVPLTEGDAAHLVRRRPLRGRARRRALPALRLRASDVGIGAALDAGQAAARRRDRRAARPARPARAARQGLLPRRPAGDLRDDAGGRALPGRATGSSPGSSSSSSSGGAPPPRSSTTTSPSSSR